MAAQVIGSTFPFIGGNCCMGIFDCAMRFLTKLDFSILCNICINTMGIYRASKENAEDIIPYY